MAVVNSTPTRPAKRAATTARMARPATPGTKTRVQTCEPIPAYGIGDGVLSFRHGLLARERGTLDKALAIVGRALRTPGTTFTTPDAVKCYLHLQMAGEQHERFAMLFLDAKNRLIAFESMFSGTLTETSVYPREVVTAAIRHGAAAVVLAHNHPSGSAQPSRADQTLTQTLKNALALVDVRVLDHVIVGHTETLSMIELGLL